ncbi:hypothetical protein [Marinicellulosiphila megalodicopiae]|uniref:hypothetical protein n=1 Tax=Marinicellulosiphila megalodicopiae TaxID=2724896 RepID=UPI003BAF46F1
MKATKLASGFAVTALAAAVSMSAMASTDVKVNGDNNEDSNANFSGSVEFKSTFEFDNASKHQSDTDALSKANEDSQAGSMSFDVKDDNFKISLKIVQDGDDDDINFVVENAIYDDGTWSISPTLGSIIVTEGAGIEGLGDPISYGVDGAFRYTDKTKAFGVKGLKFQAQIEDAADDSDEVPYVAGAEPTFHEDDSNGSDFSVAALAQFKAPGSQTEYSFNVQYAEDGVNTATDPEASAATKPFIGLMVNSKINRSLSAVASFNNGSGSLDESVDVINVLGARVNYTDNDAITAFGSFGMRDETNAIQAGVSYTLDLDSDQDSDISWATAEAKVTIPNDGDDAVEDSIQVYLKARMDYEFYYGQVEFTLETEAANNVKSEFGTKSQADYSVKLMTETTMPDGADADSAIGVEATYNFSSGVETGASFWSKAGETALNEDGSTNGVDASGLYVHTYAKKDKASEIKIWANYELEGGANLSAAYEMDTDGSRENEDDDHGPEDDRGDVNFTNKLVLTAGYSF